MRAAIRITIMTSEPSIPFQALTALLAGHASMRGDKLAVFELDSGRSVDFRGLADAGNLIAAYLEARGIGRGDRVAVLCDERLEKLLVFLAVWRIGAIACPFHVELRMAPLRALLGYIKPKLVLWHEALNGPAILRGLKLPALRFSRWPDGADELFAATRDLPPGVAIAGTNRPDDVACIFSTSGTTDQPKCVEWDHMGLWL